MIVNQRKQVNVAVVGAGTVGSGTITVLTADQDTIAARALPIKVRWIAEKDLSKAQAVVDKLNLTDTRITDNWRDAVEDPETDIVVELIGGTTLAYDILSTALSLGKSAVTANKDLMATRGGELLAIADKTNTDLFFEASVAGGIPIIQPLKESLAGNKIDSVMGIINGTTNFILTKMYETGMDFADALKEAQALGYAEADPTADIEGWDAARKIAILASLAFNSRVTFDMVYCEGITKITKWDIAYAKELGYVIKMLGIARCDGEKIEARVHPMMISEENPLASVRDSYNAVLVHGNMVENVMFYGRGAGSLPTGSAVAGDIIAAARNIAHNCKERYGCTCYQELPVVKMDDTACKYYVRIQVTDKPGVFASLSTALSDANVSMDAVLQKRRMENGMSEIVIITHRVLHRDLLTALDSISFLDCVQEVCGYIRVEE